MTDSADDLATYTPAPPVRPERPTRGGQQHATGLAVLFILFAVGGFLAFVSFITSSYIMLAMILIPLLFGGMGILHYVTWGYWLQKAERKREQEPNFWEVSQPPVSDLNPRIK